MRPARNRLPPPGPLPPPAAGAGRRLRRAACGLAAALLAAFAAAPPVRAQPRLEFAREPPEKIVTAEACGECHLAAYEVWRKTPHAVGFKTLHRTEVAERIAGKLGFRLMKRDSPCLACHYTPVVEGGQLRGVSGVSCESCHGAARDWINVHNDYGKGFDRRSETPEHRRQRLAASRAAGMRRSSDLYGVMASCYRCHTVPDETLVNVGGHVVGSIGFELVEWSQGEIRHNFLASFLSGGGTVNAQRTAAEKRTRYVLGRALELEYGLRGLAAAKEDGNYSRAMSRRVQMALIEVRKIAARVDVPEVEAMIREVRAARVVPRNRAELLAAADAVGTAAKGFLAGHDATRLAGLDPLVEGTAEPEPVLAEEAGTGPAAAPGGGSPSPATAGSRSPAPGSLAPAAGGAAPSGGRPAVGAFKRRIRPAGRYRTLGPLACSGGSCHEVPNRWWPADAHFRSAEPFFGRAERNLEIARLYGVRPGDLTKGNQVCMDCHGTVISGNESFDVFDGVGCESCHGPAKSYLEPHKEGDKALGDRRPGHVAALELGMVPLRDLEVRAERCTGCHYVTDPRLISSGHPSGEGFDYAAGMEKIRHWERPPVAAASLRAAFSRALAGRGPVPQVERAELPAGEETELARAATPGTPTRLAAATGGAWNRPRPARSGPAAASAPAPPARVGGLELPPFPEIDPSTPVEEVLLLVKQRLELLNRAVGGEP